jgi:hypothetical protein
LEEQNTEEDYKNFRTNVRSEVTEKFFEHNEDSNLVDFFSQTPVHIVN